MHICEVFETLSESGLRNPDGQPFAAIEKKNIGEIPKINEQKLHPKES